MIPQHPSAITIGDRRAVLCWLQKVCRRATVKDYSVFFLAMQFVDTYISLHHASTHSGEPLDVQLVGIVAMFMATKLLEVTFFDMAFCYRSLGHAKYSEAQIVQTENEIVRHSQWVYTHFTQFDFHSLLLGMIKRRLPSLISTVLLKAVSVELNDKLLIDLRQTLCVASLLQVPPLLKIAGMITFKLANLVDFISRDFPQAAVYEMQCLRQLWVDIVSSRLQMKAQDLCSFGAYVYQELHAFRVEVGIANGEVTNMFSDLLYN